jgi:hypothetical protein
VDGILCFFPVKILKSILTAKDAKEDKKASLAYECCFADFPLAVILRESGESRNIQADKRLDLRISEGDKGAGLRARRK